MTKPITYQQSTIIDRPAEDVWPLVADYGFDLQWRAGLTEMTPKPPGPAATGTTVHEVVRSMGSTFVSDSTVTSTSHHAYRFSGNGTSGRVQGGRRVVATGPAQSEFTYDISLTLSGLTRFLAPLLRPLLIRNLRKDLQRFRSLVEANTLNPTPTDRDLTP